MRGTEPILWKDAEAGTGKSDFFGGRPAVYPGGAEKTGYGGVSCGWFCTPPRERRV